MSMANGRWVWVWGNQNLIKPIAPFQLKMEDFWKVMKIPWWRKAIKTKCGVLFGPFISQAMGGGCESGEVKTWLNPLLLFYLRWRISKTNESSLVKKSNQDKTWWTLWCFHITSYIGLIIKKAPSSLCKHSNDHIDMLNVCCNN